ncbi:sulfatase-like hydrolase/transferase [Nonomuraea sp. NPDC052116]|uniref:sulfatase-like hydrolase/transferase n=1 Tax=Nonomuraea sp. NPDC052116 TaxID=3155665 RepID=UPI00341ECAAB
MNRPNVLWLYCDELRADALGCYATAGGLSPRTPAVDALAAGGVVFERCYTTSPVCVPSRTSALTGLLPERTGVYHNEAASPGFPLPEGLITFPEVFAASGYATASFGKEHIPPALTPWQLDDHAGAGMRDPLDGCDERSLVRTPGLRFVVGGRHPGDDYRPDEVARRAVDWMRRASGPFLLRASFLQPHTPVVPPRRWARLFEPGAQPGRALDRGPGDSRFERRFGELNNGRWMAESDLRRAQADYLASVAWVDEQIGLLLGALDELGLTGETVVVLTSDHGAHLGEGGAFGKHTFAPQSHRVPLVVRRPGHLAPARRGDLAQSLDLGPTLLGLAGLALPAKTDGRDLFADPAPGHVTATIGYGDPASRAFPNRDAGTWYGGRGWPRRTCVRTPRYRLDATVRLDGRPATPDEEDVFLADSHADPAELRNLADDPTCADVRGTLLGHVRALARSAVEAHISY